MREEKSREGRHRPGLGGRRMRRRRREDEYYQRGRT
jgi:hypothetical protein